jgi:protein-S-isoprenylcysteine O-methyltransferase Ste14
LFARVGEGTLAPWDPTRKLVVRGPYRHVRNPMITGVLAILLGEAALFGSWPLLVWAFGFFALNAIYMPLVEEPGLVRRFGDDYVRYRRNVPRWLPRLRRR